jgi:uncharacterized protein
LQSQNISLDLNLNKMATIFMSTEYPLAIAVVKAIHSGDTRALKELLTKHPDLVNVRLGNDEPEGMSRSLLHVATDWPGHFPNVAATVTVLIEAGAHVNAPFIGGHTETPLHWAASSNDVLALDALIDGGADIEAPGSVINGGSPMTDATAFACWEAAHRLVERGAQTNLFAAAALGLMDRLQTYFVNKLPEPIEINKAFWSACHGGQPKSAEYLFGFGAAINWLPPWENLTPLDAAIRSNAHELINWLRNCGAKSFKELV